MINTTIQKNNLPKNQYLLENYVPSKIAFDELKSGTDIRDHWKIFARSLERLSPGEFNRRWNEAKDVYKPCQQAKVKRFRCRGFVQMQFLIL